VYDTGRIVVPGLATVVSMDFDMPDDDDPRRAEVRQWLQDNPEPTGAQLAEAGYVAPHWPRPYGLDADPIHQLVIDEELRRAGVRRPENMIGIGWAGPTILAGGTEEQAAKYLPRLLSGEDLWCQLFSEPQAGSDLANLGTRAVRDGDEWIVNGQKIWTSFGHWARYGILLARTDPEVPKQKGITYFVCPMDAEGIEVRPIIELTGGHTFNEVFFTDVRIPHENVVGEVDDGWRLAKVTLTNERVSLSSGGALWGAGPDAGTLLDLVRSAGGVQDPVMRQELATMWIESEILRLIRLRTVSAAIQGREPGPEASIRKILADEHGQRIMAAAKDLSGAGGMIADAGPLGTDPALWHFGFLFSQALTIGGGTGDVQRNIVAERVLGLPHDTDVEKGKSWAEARRAPAGSA
jgi:alkylation response protein AidB-like acyl-CoA dehydrogenase